MNKLLGRIIKHEINGTIVEGGVRTTDLSPVHIPNVAVLRLLVEELFLR